MLLRTARDAAGLFFLTVLLVGLAIPSLGDDAAVPVPPDGPKHTLRYKFQPGEVLRSQIWHRVNLETTISGTTQTAETASGSVKVWRIKSISPERQITFEHLVESVDMRQKLSGRQEVTYNSATDKSPPPGYEMVADSVGKPLTTVTMDASGKIVKRVDHRANPPADSQNNQMVVPLPEGPVAVGETWNVPSDVTITLEDGGTKVISTRQHYKLEKVANGVATISVATQVMTPVTNPKIESQLVQRLTEGTIRFDIDAGRMLAQHLDLDKRVLGFNGADSSLHYVGRFTEEYLPPAAKTAAKSATKK